MKLVQSYGGKLATVLAAVLLLTLIFTARFAWGINPGLSITLTAPDTIRLTVTNGVTNGVYEVYWKEFLDSDTDWEWIATGTNGQTAFLVDISDTETGFFIALDGGDFDADNVLNIQDARPFDRNIGILTVTIETPANGSNVQ